MRPLSKKRRVEILRRTAAHIRRWPHLFNFWEGVIPKRSSKGSCKACILARAGALMRMRESHDSLTRVAAKLGLGSECLAYATIKDAIILRSGTFKGWSLTPPELIADALDDVAASL